MNADEKEIRELVQKWMAATKAGDTPTVLSLMTDDVLFFTPGHPPMTKEAFASLSAGQSKTGAPKIEGTSDIQEIKVLGDWAFMWTNLKVSVQPPGAAKPMVRQGNFIHFEETKWPVAACT